MTINVLDVNDVTPAFQQSVYTRPDLSEESSVGTVVFRVFAQDQDLELGGEVEYSLSGRLLWMVLVLVLLAIQI